MTDAMRTLGKVRWQATLLLAVVFGAGVAVGAAIDHTRRGAAPQQPAPPPGPPGGGRLPPYIERLGLTSGQHEKIRAILDAQRPKVDTIMNGILPRLRAISDTTFGQLRAVLTPDQQQQFDAEKPVRALAPGMPGRGGDGRPGEGRRGPPPDSRGPPPPR